MNHKNLVLVSSQAHFLINSRFMKKRILFIDNTNFLYYS